MTEATALLVDPANAGQARAWDGEEGAYWAGHAQRFDRAVAAYHGTFTAACGTASGERVLDIGCGAGQTTRDAAGAARPGPALGVDLSARMIELARRLAAGRHRRRPLRAGRHAGLRSPPGRSTWRSHARERCSSVTRPPHLPTSAGRFGQAGGW